MERAPDITQRRRLANRARLFGGAKTKKTPRTGGVRVQRTPAWRVVPGMQRQTGVPKPRPASNKKKKGVSKKARPASNKTAKSPIRMPRGTPGSATKRRTWKCSYCDVQNEHYLKKCPMLAPVRDVLEQTRQIFTEQGFPYMYITEDIWSLQQEMVNISMENLPLYVQLHEELNTSLSRIAAPASTQDERVKYLPYRTKFVRKAFETFMNKLRTIEPKIVKNLTGETAKAKRKQSADKYDAYMTAEAKKRKKATTARDEAEGITRTTARNRMTRREA